MSEPAAASPTSTEKQEVLASIDWELSVLGSRQTILGTTGWTLAAALAGTFWLLFSRQHPWSELPTLCLLVLGLSLAYEHIAGPFYSIGPPSTPEARGQALCEPFEQSEVERAERVSLRWTQIACSERELLDGRPWARPETAPSLFVGCEPSNDPFHRPLRH